MPPGYPRPYGRYVLEERIAMGGMAEIFRARTATEGFEKRVCIKRVLPHFLEDATGAGEGGGEFITMFRDEARTAAKLQHANVVQVFDFGTEDGALYLAMELVDGADLRKIMETARKRKTPLLVGEAVQIAIEMCRGLHHAHTLVENGRALGVVHRDISPHNVLVSRAGEVKVTDFGIARAAERATHTSTGIVKGKVSYMSPEQAQGHEFDHRLDQFATGIVLWEMLTGIRLFTGDGDVAILKKVLACDVPRPSGVRTEVPAALDDVVLHALAADPADRYPDMRAFELALSRFLFSGAVDPASADVRTMFARIMAEPSQPAPRKTAILDAADLGPAVPTMTATPPDGKPPSSSEDVSGVFSSSDKAPRAPGPPPGSAPGAPPPMDPNAITLMEPAPASSDTLEPAPSASPPPVLTMTGTPSATRRPATHDPGEREGAAVDGGDGVGAAPDSTPATRTNVPPGSPAAPTISLPHPRPTFAPADAPLSAPTQPAPAAPARWPLAAGAAGAVVVVGLIGIGAWVVANGAGPGDPAALASGPPTTTTATPVGAVGAVGADAVTEPVVSEPAAVDAGTAPTAPTTAAAPVVSVKATPVAPVRRVPVILQTAKGWANVTSPAGETQEVSTQMTVKLSLAPGKQTLRFKLPDGTPVPVVVDVKEAGRYVVDLDKRTWSRMR